MASTPVIAHMSSKPEINGRSAKFHSSVWGYYFLSYASDSTVAENNSDHLKFKEEVRLMLTDAVDVTMKKLFLIDSIQRLGVAYHFEHEIDEILRNINSQHHSTEHGDACADLHIVSLKFRLLRQHGYYISCDIFKPFQDDQKNFKESLIKDPRGMLSLYEASHLRIHGENILDEALEFATAQLKSVQADSISPALTAQISHALKQPIRKGLPRLEARRYFPIYQQDTCRNDVLCTFAKMDFNILQKVHQKELTVITKWWKDLDLPTNFPFARDRIVECFFWTMGVYFEPEYELARNIFTRVLSMMSILDDIYDNQGTPEELAIFTAAIERWDMAAADNLPEYMKIYYTALLNLYQDIEDEMTRQGKLYRFHYAREAVKNQAQIYFEESQWLLRQDIPTMEEYMPLALKSSGFHALAITSFVGMGNAVTKGSFEWLANYPKILKASETICRLMDDIVSHKFEQQREHIPSAIECYTKQYGITEFEAICEFNKQISYAWKDINEACFYPTAVSVASLTRILNLARIIDVLYKNEDGYTNSSTSTKAMIYALLVEPMEVCDRKSS